MTVQENEVPLLQKISRKKLKRQRAQDDHQVEFDPSALKKKSTSRASSFVRADSVNERYARVGDSSSAKKYTLPLLQLTEDGDFEALKQLLKLGADVNQKDEETEYTALHIACKNDSCDIANLLLSEGADCNAQDKVEQTPLHIAVKKDHQLCCQILLGNEKLKINTYNKTHDTALHLAAKEGRHDICRMILGHRDAKVNVKNKKGITPLHYAAQENQRDILELLLTNHADWKCKDNHSYLALHYAAQKGFQECCRVLINNISEADKEKQLKTPLKDGKTPLMLAAKGGHHKCCEVMGFVNIKATDKEWNTALHFAAQGGYDYTVTQLLEAGADPNAQNKKGSAPVLEAAGKKKFGCLKILAEKGANLNVSDKQGKNVLHYAAEKNAVETLKFLVSFPVLITIIDKKDNSNCSPLHLAIKKEADDCALLLLDMGASPVEPCSGGLTPLHLAADKGSTSVCEVLLAKKEVQVSQENDSRATPLHMAAFHGSTDVCQMLIRRGARITAVDAEGRTALHVASAEGHPNVVKYLSKKGLPLKVKDDTGSGALHLAASKGSLACCEVLVSYAKASCWELDQNGNLPLDRAFKDKNKLSEEDLEKHDQVFKFLLMNLCYKVNTDRHLRIHRYMHKALEDGRVVIVEAIVDSCWWEAGISGENRHQCQNFRSLIKDHPCIALKLQNKCIICCKENGSKVIYDFRLFEDNYYIPSAIDPLAKSPFDPKTHQVLPKASAFVEDGLKWKEQHPLTLMIDHQRHQLLHHPLVRTWLWRKWSSYIYIIFLIRFLIEILFAVFLTCFMGIADNWMHVEEKCKLLSNGTTTKQEFCTIADNLSSRLSQNNGSSFGNTTEDPSPLPQFSDLEDDNLLCVENYMAAIGMKRLLWSGLLALTSVLILLELNFVIRLRKLYFTQPDHYLQDIRIIFTLAVLIPGGICEFHYVILKVENWQSGIVALLLTWLHLINTMNELPAFSVFMPVTSSFIKSFFKVIFYIIMIIFVFAFTFHLLLRDQSAFSTVPQAMVKTIVWMLGDLAYDDTFLPEEQALYYPIMVNSLFVVFVTILGGFIANMVITQPANKLENFRDKALFHRAASRTKLFLKLDICFPFFRKRRTVGSFVDDESKNINFLLKRIVMLDTKEEFRPDKEVSPLQLQLEEVNKQFAALQIQFQEQREEVKDLKHQINFLVKILSEQKQS
ncbi:transient receptor potential cation channel subfamily A member 1-like isoform X1 [Macrobrachium rosenbergii]|uniref:transient receptor potential cation channel subfamily A member 1-like isoform X1 n=1 Tax=Macrobrachium rosenbergii TaxID=79674 RepID=UPI0034D4DB81